MNGRFLVTLLTLGLIFPLAGCGPSDDDLVVYSGRSQSLVSPIVERFEEETGHSVTVRYGDTAQLAVAIREEGERSRADVFWAQDAGALGAVHADGHFMSIPDSIHAMVPDQYVNDAETWVATSGRARTLAYNTDNVSEDELPERLFDLTDDQYEGRVGWAPTNGSFQSHVTAIRSLVGDDTTRKWLQEMRENGTTAYTNNTAIVQGIADGEVDMGLPNHYYLYRFLAEDPDFPVDQRYFEASDPGNLVNVAGAGIIAHSGRDQLAAEFLAYLLSPDAQRYFVDEVYEYPVIEGIEPHPDLQDLGELGALQPQLDLDELRDLEQTLDMLRDVGLL